MKKYSINILFNLVLGVVSPILAFASSINISGFMSPPTRESITRGWLIAISSIVIVIVGELLLYRCGRKKRASFKVNVAVTITSFLFGVFLLWVYAIFNFF